MIFTNLFGNPRLPGLLLPCYLLLGLCAGQACAVDEIIGEAKKLPSLPEIKVAADDWPWWRGPASDGISTSPPPLLKWQVRDTENQTGADEGIVWQTEIPGRGHASPIVWGDQIFLATADETDETQSLLALDRATGKKLWQTELHRGGFMKRSHKQNSHASATPACDGERVITVFIHDRGLWVTATTLDGKILWQTRAGDYDAIYGFGSSPAIHGSLVIVLADNDQTGAFLAAIHRKTGEIVWRVKRPHIDTYATPIVAHIAGRDQLVMGGSELTSYDPNTGAILWKCAGPTAETTANTAVFSKDHVFCSGGYPKPYALIAVAADGAGEVTKTHVKWRTAAKMPYVPSPLYRNGRLFIVEDYGIASCLDAERGKPLWTKRLGGDTTSSPVLCGDRVYVANEDGQVFVFAAKDKFELLATSQMHDGVMATPTIVGKRIYLRTLHKLYCIGD